MVRSKQVGPPATAAELAPTVAATLPPPPSPPPVHRRHRPTITPPSRRLSTPFARQGRRHNVDPPECARKQPPVFSSRYKGWEVGMPAKANDTNGLSHSSLFMSHSRHQESALVDSMNGRSAAAAGKLAESPITQACRRILRVPPSGAGISTSTPVTRVQPGDNPTHVQPGDNRIRLLISTPSSRRRISAAKLSFSTALRAASPPPSRLECAPRRML